MSLRIGFLQITKENANCFPINLESHNSEKHNVTHNLLDRGREKLEEKD